MKRINLIALTALMTVVGFNANGITETQRQAAMKKVFNNAQTPTTPTTKTVSTEEQRQAAMKKVFDNAQNTTTNENKKTTSRFGSVKSAFSTAVSTVLSYKKTLGLATIVAGTALAYKYCPSIF